MTEGWRFQRNDPAGAGDALSYDTLKPWLLPTSNAFIIGTPHQRPAGDEPGAKVTYAQSSFDDSGWRQLNLPHDWGIEGPFDMNLPGETAKLPWFGVAWYRKALDLPASNAGRRIVLEVDGAMSRAAVWCNGRLVGGWPYGYASWQLDLTDYLKFGQVNALVIRIDNLNDSSRWYPGGGVYRNVWLTKTAPIHVAQWGTFVTTPEISAQHATVDVRADFVNQSSGVADIRYAHQIFAADKDGRPTGKPLASSTPGKLTLGAGETKQTVERFKLDSPSLWSPASPARYVEVTQLKQGGKVIDHFETLFGIREAKFTADDGFHLNGKKLPIQGVCMHHDLGALGAAFNTRAAERQLEILKEMGVNAIRLSHNPPAPEFLDLCDSMGFLVIDELTDTWTRPKKPNGYATLFNDWAEADLRAMMRRDRNHPSVVMWSIGNEVGEQGQKPPKTSQWLTDICHAEDATRPSTAACDRPGAATNGFQNTVDVYGFNYKPHLYEKFHQDNPQRPVYGSETASTISSRGEYLFPVDDNKDGGKIGYQMSSYDLYAPGWAQPPDLEFAAQDKYPFVAGEFVWTGFDYLGEPTPFNKDLTVLSNYHSPEARAKAEAELEAVGKLRPPSRSSYFGIVDLAGFKKDRFYLYQSRWRPDLPMAHILPHWNWPERIGQLTPVHVYTSGDEAELFLNGVSLGRKTKSAFEYRLRWDDVIYAPGELKVVAYKDGKEWAREVVKTAGPAVKLVLKVDRKTIKADGRDLCFITASVTDSEGRIVPRADNTLHFDVAGLGEIIATDNGDPTSHESFQASERKAFNGLCLAIVRTQAGKPGKITIRAQSAGLEPAEASITSK